MADKDASAREKCVSDSVAMQFFVRAMDAPCVMHRSKVETRHSIGARRIRTKHEWGWETHSCVCVCIMQANLIEAVASGGQCTLPQPIHRLFVLSSLLLFPFLPLCYPPFSSFFHFIYMHERYFLSGRHLYALCIHFPSAAYFQNYIRSISSGIIIFQNFSSDEKFFIINLCIFYSNFLNIREKCTRELRHIETLVSGIQRFLIFRCKRPW